MYIREVLYYISLEKWGGELNENLIYRDNSTCRYTINFDTNRISRIRWRLNRIITRGRMQFSFSWKTIETKGERKERRRKRRYRIGGNLIRRIIQTQGGRKEFCSRGEAAIIRDFWWIGSIINSWERSFLSRGLASYKADWVTGNECTYTCNECLNSNCRSPSAGDDVCLWNTLSERIYTLHARLHFPGRNVFASESIDVERLFEQITLDRGWLGQLSLNFLFFLLFLIVSKQERIRIKGGNPG